MTLQQILYAITISEQGSFNKASEVLYIAQPSLTESMKELEKELQITIFNRSGRGVTLTGDGRDFISYARELYHQYENMMDKYGDNGKRNGNPKRGAPERQPKIKFSVDEKSQDGGKKKRNRGRVYVRFFTSNSRHDFYRQIKNAGETLSRILRR